MMTGRKAVARVADRIRRHTSHPSMPGICTSSRTTSTLRCASTSSASCPAGSPVSTLVAARREDGVEQPQVGRLVVDGEHRDAVGPAARGPSRRPLPARNSSTWRGRARDADRLLDVAVEARAPGRAPRSSGIARAVTAMTGTRAGRPSSRSRRSVSWPSIPGSCRSSRTRSGGAATAAPTPASPDSAVRTSYPACSSTSRTSLRLSGLSSMTRIARCSWDQPARHRRGR